MMPKSVAAETVEPVGKETRTEWVAKIIGVHNRNAEAIVELGQTLLAAKTALHKRGQWVPMFKGEELPFSLSLAERYMKIARMFPDSASLQNLPSAVSTLYELSKLTDEEFGKRKADGSIHQGLTRKGAAALNKPRRNKILPPADEPEHAVGVDAILYDIQDQINVLSQVRQPTDADLEWARTLGQRLIDWSDGQPI